MRCEYQVESSPLSCLAEVHTWALSQRSPSGAGLLTAD